jgi:Transposase IS66 family
LSLIRQICWAHLIRKFVAFSQRKDEGAAIGESLLLIAQAMLSAWHQVRDGTLSRSKYQQMARRAQTVIEAQLVRGIDLELKAFSGSCADILFHKDALFTFAFTAGVEPTSRVGGRRGGVRYGESLLPAAFARCRCLSPSVAAVSGPRHIEPDRRISRIRLAARVSSHRVYVSFPAGAAFARPR